jgi:hypothetical protein
VSKQIRITKPSTRRPGADEPPPPRPKPIRTVWDLLGKETPK